MKIKEGLTFDDVLLIPKYSTIKSRKGTGIDISTYICGNQLDIPIISSPMDTVTEKRMADKLRELGGMGILHRFTDPKTQANWMDFNFKNAVAVGATSKEKDRVNLLYEYGANIFVIDIAHGDSRNCIDMLHYIKTNCKQAKVIAGSVATYAGTKNLIEAGADGIRCGVGNGSICITRLVTGFGVPSLTGIMECARAIEDSKMDITLIADGGIRNSGDIVKALAAGADVVMLGNLLAGTDEAPGDLIEGEGLLAGKKFKIYRGMASSEAYKDRNGFVPDEYTPEGVNAMIPYKGSLEKVINKLVGGIRSGLSYGGAYTIYELQLQAEFIRITGAGLKESKVHDVEEF